jgi:putative PIN family toxin of toxin-antitoxin system
VLRVTLDTNVIVSGLNFPGNPRHILQMAESGVVKLAVSDAILAEVADVLQRDKFGWSRSEVNWAKTKLLALAEHVTPAHNVDVVKQDPDDNRILECAAAARSEYLVTGDKHLLALGQFGPTTVLTPGGFVGLAQGKER